MIEFILLCVCWLLWKLGQPKRSDPQPPYLKGWWPIVGHSFSLLLNTNTIDLMRYMKATSAECARVGGVATLQYGFQRYYLIIDPKDALKVANECINKHYSYDFAKRWLGKGLITASGRTWRSHRRMIVPAFSMQVMLGFQDDINNQAREMVHKLTDKIGKGKFDISVYLKEMAAANICLTAFGISASDDSFLNSYTGGVDQMLQLIVKRFNTVWLHNDLIYQMSDTKRKEDEVLKVLNGLSDEVIRRKRTEMQNNNRKTPDSKAKPFLELLLELSEENALSDQEVREEIDTMISASIDTTPWILMYTLVYLGSYPEIQEKVYNEIEEVLGKTGDLEKSNLSQLVYMEMVIKESLRLHAPPMTLRTLESDIQLQNYKLKAGSHCLILLYGVHRDPCWGADQETFRPERWMEPGIQDNVFGGFSFGRRTCIGKPYAMMSMKSALCYLLRRYKVTANVEELESKVEFVMKAASGHFVSIEER